MAVHESARLSLCGEGAECDLGQSRHVIGGRRGNTLAYFCRQ